MCTVNTAVLDMIRSETPVPDGGELGRDVDGGLDGLVMEQAQSMVRDLVYPLTVDRIVDAIDQASKRYRRGCDVGDGSRRRCGSCVTQPHRADGVDGGSEARVLGIREFARCG